MNIDNIYLKNCNSAKVILMLCIVIGHCISPYASQTWFTIISLPNVRFLEVGSRFLNSFHIYAFTLISGYIFYYQKFEKGKYGNYKKFIKNKVLRLIVPYIAFSLVWAVPFRVIFFDESVSQLFVKFVIADSPEQLWFLLMLFFVFAIYSPFAEWIDKHYLSATAFICGLYIIGTIWDFTLDYFQFFKALRFLIFFHAGCSLRKFKSWFETLRKYPTWIYIAIFAILFSANEVLLLVQKTNIILKMTALLLGFILNLYGAISCFLCLQKYDISSTKIISYLGDKTMAIYLLHQQLVYLFTFLLCFITTNAAFVVPVCFMAVLCVSVVLANLLTRCSVTRIGLGISKK